MLKNCPECELPVSDKALDCPHCGYPFVSNVSSVTKRTNGKKRMSLPNGFGQITKITDHNLRKPYRAMVTVGKNKNGRPICKLLKPQSYFESYNDAYSALVEYNKNPYDMDDCLTFKELYEKWSQEYFETIASSSQRTVKAAWTYCEELYDEQVNTIRARHLKGCIENSSASGNTKSRMKSVFNLMYDYAMEHDVVDKNYARTFNLSENIIKDVAENYRGHTSFTNDELELLWNCVDVPYVNIILYQCYSGWRPQELGLIKTCDVDLDKGYVMGGMKTKAGTNRVVPIHPRVKNIIEDLYNEAVSNGSEYLITCEGGTLTYDKYNKRFRTVKESIGLNQDHKPHDPRKQFITMCKKYEVDEYAIKRMVGHAISDITESVYTDRDVKWLSKEIAKIEKKQQSM